jgi:cation:H+ antiporter
VPAALVRRLVLCLAIATPALAFRITGFRPDPVIDLLVFGAAVVAASFVLAWAAESAQKDISGALAIAILALIAVLPEYAVDLYYAFRSGSEPEYEQYAAANMTGSNRLLLGFGWPLVALIAIHVARRTLAGTRMPGGGRLPAVLELPRESRLDLGVLTIVAVLAFAIPAMGQISLWFGILLILIFCAYLWRASRVEDDGEEEFVGTAAVLVALPTLRRRIIVIAMFLGSAAIILSSAEPFAESLVESGSSLGIDSYFLVQWLAPLASEAPEFIIAVMFALRGMGAAAIATLVASKVNQWTLLVGSLPVAHGLGGGGWEMHLDSRQVEEFFLTASQTVMGVAILLGLRFHRWSAIALAALFAVQFAITDELGRWILSGVHLALGIGFLVYYRRELLPTVTAPFRRISRATPERETVPDRRA